MILNKPGVYPHAEMADYLAAPAISASIIKEIVNRCPKAAWHESWLNERRIIDVSNAEQSAGSIAHSILLEGSTACVCVVDPKDYPSEPKRKGEAGTIPVGWTNKAIKGAKAAAIADGKIPVLLGDMAEINAMVAAARDFIESLRGKENEPAIWEAFQPDGGDSEITMLWQDGPTLCKMRPDRISKDRGVIIDYKTGKTSSEPDVWGRTQMVRMGYYVGGAFYRRGIEQMLGISPAYVFLTQEQQSPWLCSLVGMDNHAFALGGDKVDRGLTRWAQCAKTGRFPAYATRVVYPEIPDWEERQWGEKAISGFGTIDHEQLEYGVQA